MTKIPKPIPMVATISGDDFAHAYRIEPTRCLTIAHALLKREVLAHPSSSAPPNSRAAGENKK